MMFAFKIIVIPSAVHSTITAPVSSKRVYFEKAHGFYRARASPRNSKSFLSFNTLNDTLSLNYISNSQDWCALEIKADAPLHDEKLSERSSGSFAYSCANWRDRNWQEDVWNHGFGGKIVDLAIYCHVYIYNWDLKNKLNPKLLSFYSLILSI